MKSSIFTETEKTVTSPSNKRKTAFALYQEELLNGCILSYIEKLDEVLKDVIIPETITELTGYSGSGKTQVCFRLCISVQLPKCFGGCEGKSLYISTNRNFAVQRIKELAKDFVEQLGAVNRNANTPFNEESILKNIHYVKIDSTEELLVCLIHLQEYLLGKNIRLIVIDSLSYLLRQLKVNGRIEVINKIFLDLRVLAEKFNFAVVLTNDFTTRVDEGVALVTPSFGDSFYHLVNSRIDLSKTGTIFQAKLVKNLMHAPKEVYFTI